MIVRLLGLLLPVAVLVAQTRVDLDVAVPAMADPATIVPITIFEGAKPGPTLVITCGVHGFEYVPILAAQRLLTEIDPKQLSGRVVLVRLAHVAAFETPTVFFNPNDRKNLNRVFPGSPTGTQTERIAHVISEWIGKGDLHIDMHGGDATEGLADFVGSYGGKLAEAQAATSSEMARVFGLGRIVEYRMDNQAQVDTGRSCNRQAVAMGKPTILVEIGGRGQAQANEVGVAVRGVINVLKSQKMLPGAPMLNRMMPQKFTSTASADFTKSGIWYPAVTAGADVKTGALVGVVKSYAGEELERVVAPADGLVLYMQLAPPARAGAPAITIARPQLAK